MTTESSSRPNSLKFSAFKAQSATRYLWTGESERCRCTHSVESHKTVLKDPFTAICYGDFTNTKRPCKCHEFVSYRHISEEVFP